MTLASRMGVMDRGRIVQVGTPTEIYESPASKFVADFIGSVNLFEGEVTHAAPEGVRIRSNELGCDMQVAHSPGCQSGATVWVAVRPEKMSLSRSPGEPAEVCVRGVVKEVAYMGDMSVYLVEIASGRTVRVTQPNSKRAAEDRIGRDEPVYLSWHGSSPVLLTR